MAHKLHFYIGVVKGVSVCEIVNFLFVIIM